MLLRAWSLCLSQHVAYEARRAALCMWYAMVMVTALAVSTRCCRYHYEMLWLLALRLSW